MENEDAPIAEAGVGGGSNKRPPNDVLCGDDPERRDERMRRQKRELIRLQQEAMRIETERRLAETRRLIREIHNAKK